MIHKCFQFWVVSLLGSDAALESKVAMLSPHPSFCCSSLKLWLVPFLKSIPLQQTFQISFQSISTLLLSFQTVHFLVKNVIIHPGLGQYFWLSIISVLPPVCSEHEVMSLFPPCTISFGVKMTDLNFMLFLFL